MYKKSVLLTITLFAATPLSAKQYSHGQRPQNKTTNIDTRLKPSLNKLSEDSGIQFKSLNNKTHRPSCLEMNAEKLNSHLTQLKDKRVALATGKTAANRSKIKQRLNIEIVPLNVSTPAFVYLFVAPYPTEAGEEIKDSLSLKEIQLNGLNFDS